MAQEWNIKSRGHCCRACEKEFNDQDDCYSALMFTEEGYVRGDYCSDCWVAQDLESSAFSTWHGIFIVPLPAKEEPLKKETAESLLRKMLEDDEPNIGVIYILAVMLERKRILVERDVKTCDDGSILRIYEHKKSGETFLVTEPHLQLDKLEEVQQQVVELLGGKSEDGGRKSEDGDQKSEEKEEALPSNDA